MNEKLLLYLSWQLRKDNSYVANGGGGNIYFKTYLIVSSSLYMVSGTRLNIWPIEHL